MVRIILPSIRKRESLLSGNTDIYLHYNLSMQNLSAPYWPFCERNSTTSLTAWTSYWANSQNIRDLRCLNAHDTIVSPSQMTYRFHRIENGSVSLGSFLLPIRYLQRYHILISFPIHMYPKSSVYDFDIAIQNLKWYSMIPKSSQKLPGILFVLIRKNLLRW